MPPNRKGTQHPPNYGVATVACSVLCGGWWGETKCRSVRHCPDLPTPGHTTQMLNIFVSFLFSCLQVFAVCLLKTAPLKHHEYFISFALPPARRHGSHFFTPNRSPMNQWPPHKITVPFQFGFNIKCLISVPVLFRFGFGSTPWFVHIHTVNDTLSHTCVNKINSAEFVCPLVISLSPIENHAF